MRTFIWESPEPTGTYSVSFYAADKDGTTEKTIDITVLPTPFVDTNCHVVISEYVEGSSNNKALEIFNPTVDAIDLNADSYVVLIYANGGSSPANTIPLTGTIPVAGCVRAGQQLGRRRHSRRGGHDQRKPGLQWQRCHRAAQRRCQRPGGGQYRPGGG